MAALIALFLIVVISLVVVRVGATALMLTGLSWDHASFQAYSAFFGVGFTTSEAEAVVDHPVRRRIVRDLIIAGNIGLTSALATLVVSFVDKASGLEMAEHLGFLLGGAVVLFILTRIGLLQRLLDRIIRFSLRRAGLEKPVNYDLVLRVGSGFCVSELPVRENSPFAGLLLGESRPADAGIIVLGITRANGGYVGVPKRHERLEVGDVLIVYGSEDALAAASSGPDESDDPNGLSG